MNIFALNDLRQQAEHAAEQGMAADSNPYPPTDPAHDVWAEAYRAHLDELKEVAA